MDNKIYPCLWCNENAAEAADFYTEVFKDTKITSQNPLVTMLQLDGQNLMFLNAGPAFTKNASISFMVMCGTAAEVENYYQKLLPGAKVLMDLNTYPWSEKYAWIEDRFGVSWQLFTGDNGGAKETAVPTLMFTQSQNGKARNAIKFYTSVFPNSSIKGIIDYPEGSGEATGNVMHAQFDIDGYTLMAMDGGSSHEFSFNEGISLVVSCKDQEEIDYYWNQLSGNGGSESQCGWLKDQFGISWQIVPADLEKWMSSPEKSRRVMEALMKMKKLDISVLKNA